MKKDGQLSQVEQDSRNILTALLKASQHNQESVLAGVLEGAQTTDAGIGTVLEKLADKELITMSNGQTSWHRLRPDAMSFKLTPLGKEIAIAIETAPANAPIKNIVRSHLAKDIKPLETAVKDAPESAPAQPDDSWYPLMPLAEVYAEAITAPPGKPYKRPK